MTTEAEKSEAERVIKSKVQKAPEDAEVVVPAAVDLPQPQPDTAHVAVPASVNGRDLRKGKP